MSMRSSGTPSDPVAAADAFFVGHPDALVIFRRIRALVERNGSYDLQVTRSQVAFRRRAGFAYVWLPGRWLRRPSAEVVLSVALPRRDLSRRWKQVVNPSRGVWMHHLEVRSTDDLDGQVAGWLREAYLRAE